MGPLRGNKIPSDDQAHGLIQATDFIVAVPGGPGLKGAPQRDEFGNVIGPFDSDIKYRLAWLTKHGLGKTVAEVQSLARVSGPRSSGGVVDLDQRGWAQMAAFEMHASEGRRNITLARDGVILRGGRPTEHRLTDVSQNADRPEPLRHLFEPSAGITPSFGSRQVVTSDGLHYLYLMILNGDPSCILGRDKNSAGNQCIVKVGYSREPARRCDELNSALPPAGLIQLSVAHTSQAFENGTAAKEAEDRLKLSFYKNFESLGGEFFLGPFDRMETAFGLVADEVAYKERGRAD